MTLLNDFIKESNMIEGIIRPVENHELVALQKFMELDQVTTRGLVDFVQTIQPDAQLRSNVGMNVRVGDHIAPLGGDAVVNELAKLLKKQGSLVPHEMHCRYLTLHPFTDGNGRSARALWLWMASTMDLMKVKQLGFLHTFYYQTLSAHDGRT